jgi:hypothetical protein
MHTCHPTPTPKNPGANLVFLAPFSEFFSDLSGVDVKIAILNDFRQLSANFFIEKQCNDQIFAKTSSTSLIKKTPIVSPFFGELFLK